MATSKRPSGEALTPSFYRAIIVSDMDTQKKIIRLFNLLKFYTVGDRKLNDETHKEGLLMKTKTELVKSMKEDLEVK